MNQTQIQIDRESRGERGYSRIFRSFARALWNGSISESDFITGVNDSISSYLYLAWLEGSKQCGITAVEELTDSESKRIKSLISSEQGYVPQLAAWIVENGKANGGKIRPILSRIDGWITRYGAVRTEGRVSACSDKKYKWEINPANKNCSSCLKLNGKIKRGSFWQEKGIIPQMAGAWYLECHGFNCGCNLVETNEKVSPGRLPSLP